MDRMPFDLECFYDDYPAVEQEFQSALEASLQPRGPHLLFDIVADLGLPSGASALDVGCGEGQQAVELAQRFGLDVHGVEPVPRHVTAAKQLAAVGRTWSIESGSAWASPSDYPLTTTLSTWCGVATS